MKKCKITVLKTTFDKELAAEFGAPGVAICSCNDGLRPVIFKIEATQEEAEINYEPIKRSEQEG